MTKYEDTQIEQLLTADLSDRSRIKHSLKADLLEGRTHRQRPTWILGAASFAIIALMLAGFALIMSGGGRLSVGVAPDATITATPLGTATVVPITHVVQEGETMHSIVALYGWDDSIIPEVIRLNNLEDNAVLYVGRVLLIPARIVNAPFPPCPPGTVIDVPPTMVPGQVVTTPYPTIPPCDPGRSVNSVGIVTAYTPADASRAAGFPGVTLTYVPADYAFVSYRVETGHVITANYQSLDDQLSVMQAFQTLSLDEILRAYQDTINYQITRTTVRGVEAAYLEDAVAHLLVWPEGDFTFTVSSSRLSLDELSKIAESVQMTTAGDFGPNGVITATPLPYDPNVPTVPPSVGGLPTPTPMDYPPILESTPLYQGTSIDQAGAAAGFEVQRPSYLPTGASLWRYTVYADQREGSHASVQTLYVGQTSFMIAQISPVVSISEYVDVNPATNDYAKYFHVTDVTINGYAGKYVENDPYLSSSGVEAPAEHQLLWIDGSFTFLIKGSASMTKEDLIRIAESLE